MEGSEGEGERGWGRKAQTGGSSAKGEDEEGAGEGEGLVAIWWCWGALEEEEEEEEEEGGGDGGLWARGLFRLLGGVREREGEGLEKVVETVRDGVLVVEGGEEEVEKGEGVD